MTPRPPRMLRPGTPVLPSWSAAQWEASEARDRERRAAAPVVPSTSVVPCRCATCGHWNAATAWNCADCGLRFEPRPLGGFPPVR